MPTVKLIPEDKTDIETGDLLTASAGIEIVTGDLLGAESAADIVTGDNLAPETAIGLTPLGG